MAFDKSTCAKIFLLVAVLLNVLLWMQIRHVQGRWLGVPPVPSEAGAVSLTLGDGQLAYRMLGLTLQNLGDTGGRSVALNKYDYSVLGKWFFLVDRLDPQSQFAPFLASFYYASTQNPQQLYPLIDYLALVGQRPGGQRWRWLAQAVYMARFQVQDQDKALEVARILAALPEEGLPAWTKQMPAFILKAKGNKEEALAVMLEIVKTSGDKIQKNELNFTIEYICSKLLEQEKRKEFTFCKEIP